jgi:high affinity sulfate transporter 1
MFRRFGTLRGFEGYKGTWLGRDAMAGLAVAAVAIPSAVAYPAIAGLPAEVGIYSSIFSLLGYALLGPSRQLIVGPDAATMTVLAGALAAAPIGASERIAVASALALAVGLMCIIGSKLRLGVVAAFLSKPILVGFISGVSISILVGQIGRFTGLRIESDGLFPPIVELLQKAASIHWPSVALGVAMFVILQLATLSRFPVPGPLLVVIVAVVASALFDFDRLGIKVVGDLPTALPTLSLPLKIDFPMRELFLGAIAVWLVSYGSGIVTARGFAARSKFEVDADAELMGFGAANLASGLFGGFPVTVSDSRTAINVSVGGRSQMSGVVAAIALGAALLYLNDALRLLPNPALGAILAAAAISLIDLKGLREIWRISRMEFAFALIGMSGPISLGVLDGVVVAIGATLLYVLLKEMRPRDAVLGRVPDRSGFYKLHRTKGAQAIPGLIVYLIEGSLLFFNVEFVKSRLMALAQAAPPETRWFVLDASAIVQIDSTAAAMLEDVHGAFAKQGMAMGIAGLHYEPRALLDRAGLLEIIGQKMLFEDLEDIMPAFERISREADVAGGHGQDRLVPGQSGKLAC